MARRETEIKVQQNTRLILETKEAIDRTSEYLNRSSSNLVEIILEKIFNPKRYPDIQSAIDEVLYLRHNLNGRPPVSDENVKR
jgi:hypothetical protein